MALLTVKQVAAMKDVDESTVRRWIRTRQLPAKRFGERLWLVDRQAAKIFAPQPVGNPAFTGKVKKS